MLERQSFILTLLVYFIPLFVLLSYCWHCNKEKEAVLAPTYYHLHELWYRFCHIMGRWKNPTTSKTCNAHAAGLKPDGVGDKSQRIKTQWHIARYTLGSSHNHHLCCDILTWMDLLHCCYETNCQYDSIGNLWAPDWIKGCVPDTKNKEHYLA